MGCRKLCDPLDSDRNTELLALVGQGKLVFFMPSPPPRKNGNPRNSQGHSLPHGAQVHVCPSDPVLHLQSTWSTGGWTLPSRAVPTPCTG